MRGSKESRTTGSFQAQAKVSTWVEPTDVTVHFDQPLIIKDVWNSEIIDGGVASKTVTLRMKKMPGSWYGERKSAFGFSADGDIARLPHVTCVPGNPLPTPPPPSPPRMPPASPPFFSASERACFLGGGAIFTDAPDQDPIIGWMRPWKVSVVLQRWIAGTRIVLDFQGQRLTYARRPTCDPCHPSSTPVSPKTPNHPALLPANRFTTHVYQVTPAEDPQG